MRGDTLKKTEQVPMTEIKLNEVFTVDGWKKLGEWNDKINARIHSGVLPTTRGGKYCLVLPSADFDGDTVSFFKTISVKGRLCSDENQLEVKDDLALSGSSQSES